EEHAEEMAVVLSDPALYTFTGGEPPDPEALRARYACLASGSDDPAVSWGNWVIESRAESCLTGYVQATITLAEGGRHAEIAWVVGTPWQGRGIATEATRAMAGRLRQQSVRDLIAHIHPDHRASAAVATAAGLAPTDRWHDGEVRWQRRL
ncbi:MAG: GNAT family N-acetyltransferase, partial [Streptomyces sp.]|uniref:GNAT family N-acetyltransferase n=1 Tax=Streptomyces sp. TaxID=1931 RepID=UPI003D6AD31C